MRNGARKRDRPDERAAAFLFKKHLTSHSKSGIINSESKKKEFETMKVLCVILLVLLLLILTSPVRFYALTTQVVEIDRDAGIVTVEDANGNLWEFEGVEDWEVGDCASMIMSDNGTDAIFDDEILDIRYSNWTLTH